jgi:hypothetical protein
MRLLRITAPHFVAGIEVAMRSGTAVVVRAAPILAWTLGKNVATLARYFDTKSWTVEIL